MIRRQVPVPVTINGVKVTCYDCLACYDNPKADSVYFLKKNGCHRYLK
jgi:hypothetical protein